MVSLHTRPPKNYDEEMSQHATTTPSPIMFRLSQSPQRSHHINATPPNAIEQSDSPIAFNLNDLSNDPVAFICENPNLTTTTSTLRWDQTTYTTPTHFQLSLSPIYPETQPLPFLYTPPTNPNHIV